MFFCQDCEAVFPEPEIKIEIEHYEFWGAETTHKYCYDACPVCGSYEIFDMPEEADED